MISKRTSRPYVADADTAPAYWMIGVLWHVLATSVQTGNALCLLDQLCSVGSGPPRHSHTQEEALYVARGQVTFSAGGMDFTAGPGSLVTVPRRTEHSFIVDEEATLINFYFPAGFDLWLMGSAVPAQRNELPPADTPMPPFQLTKKLSDDYAGLPMTEERTTSPNPDAPAAPTMTSRATAQNFWYERGCWSILADGDSTGGSYSVFEVETPHGLGEKTRVYDDTDKAYYLFDGEIDVLIDDTVHTLAQGGFAFIPRGSVHAVRVTSETARYLVIHTTPGYERILRACGTPAKQPGLPPTDWQPSTPPGQLHDLHADVGLRTIAVPVGFAHAPGDNLDEA